MPSEEDLSLLKKMSPKLFDTEYEKFEILSYNSFARLNNLLKDSYFISTDYYFNLVAKGDTLTGYKNLMVYLRNSLMTRMFAQRIVPNLCMN